LETHFSTQVGPALALCDKYNMILLLDEIRTGAFGLAPDLPGMGSPGAGVKDTDPLHSIEITALANGTFFRISKVNTIL
jgi:hypothetical protein